MGDPQWLEGAALEGVLPHRGANMLVDAARVWTEGGVARGEARLSVLPGDAAGRDVFLSRSADGSTSLMAPALVEHLALLGIVVMRPDMAGGDLAFFSTISGFAAEREPREGETLSSAITKRRDKGSFRRFEGVVAGEDGSPVCAAEIMAYSAPPSVASRRETAKLVAAPVAGAPEAVDRSLFAWKRSEMVFVDDLVHVSGDGREATFRYTYPAGHPFCPGHFPGNPVMMGVTQWIAVADAAHLLARRAGDAGPEVRADGEIVRESGALVAEVKGLVLEGGPETRAGISGTARVGFRDLVRPGETVFVRARLSG